MKLTLVGLALQVISVRRTVVLFKWFAAEEKNWQNPSAMLCFSVSILLSIVRKVVVRFEDFDFVGLSFLTVFQNLSGLLEVPLNSLEIKFFFGSLYFVFMKFRFRFYETQCNCFFDLRALRYSWSHMFIWRLISFDIQGYFFHFTRLVTNGALLQRVAFLGFF